MVKKNSESTKDKSGDAPSRKCLRAFFFSLLLFLFLSLLPRKPSRSQDPSPNGRNGLAVSPQETPNSGVRIANGSSSTIALPSHGPSGILKGPARDPTECLARATSVA